MSTSDIASTAGLEAAVDSPALAANMAAETRAALGGPLRIPVSFGVRPRAHGGVSGRRGPAHVQQHGEPRQRRARLYRRSGLGQRRLVEPQGARLRDLAARRAGGAVLLRLRDGRARRRMEGQGLHVHHRPRVQGRRTAGLLHARLRPHRLLRGRHRQRREELDGAAHRPAEFLEPVTPVIQTSRTADRGGASTTDLVEEPLHSRRSRRVKIIATLGPASADRETVAALFAAGADVFRINMSHASHDAMRERVARIRALEEETGRPIGVLVDLQGPKLRLGLFADGGAELHKGDVFVLDSDPAPGDAGRVQLPHPEILSSLASGHRILVDDGKVMLRVVEPELGRASTVVEVAGRVSNKKGVSLPDTTIPTSAMTDKDRADLKAALEENIDWIALSSVQRPEDVAEVKAIAKGRALVMAKIEKPDTPVCSYTFFRSGSRPGPALQGGD